MTERCAPIEEYERHDCTPTRTNHSPLITITVHMAVCRILSCTEQLLFSYIRLFQKKKIEPAHLSHCRATKAQVSLCRCADSPEASLQADT